MLWVSQLIKYLGFGIDVRHLKASVFDELGMKLKNQQSYQQGLQINSIAVELENQSMLLILEQIHYSVNGSDTHSNERGSHWTL